MGDTLDLDVSEIVFGFLQGRSLAMSDWHVRKEQRETERLVRMLKSRRFRTRAMADRQSERYKRLRASQNLYRRGWSKREKNRAKLAAKRKAKRHRQLRGKVITCRAPYCRATWCPIPGRKGRHEAYCSKACAKRAETARERDYYRKRKAKHAMGAT